LAVRVVWLNLRFWKHLHAAALHNLRLHLRLRLETLEESWWAELLVRLHAAALHNPRLHLRLRLETLELTALELPTLHTALKLPALELLRRWPEAAYDQETRKSDRTHPVAGPC